MKCGGFLNDIKGTLDVKPSSLRKSIFGPVTVIYK